MKTKTKSKAKAKTKTKRSAEGACTPLGIGFDPFAPDLTENQHDIIAEWIGVYPDLCGAEGWEDYWENG